MKGLTVGGSWVSFLYWVSSGWSDRQISENRMNISMLQRRKMTGNKIGINNKIARHQQQHHVHVARTKTFYTVSRAVWLCHRLLSLFWSFSYSRGSPSEKLPLWAFGSVWCWCCYGNAVVMLRISKHRRECWTSAPPQGVLLHIPVHPPEERGGFRSAPPCDCWAGDLSGVQNRVQILPRTPWFQERFQDSGLHMLLINRAEPSTSEEAWKLVWPPAIGNDV